MPLLLLHANGLDDLLIAIVAVIYMALFFGLSRIKTVRQKREKLRHQSQNPPPDDQPKP